MINAGIIGSTGYVAGELIRILLNHPKVKLQFLYSHSSAGQLLKDVHPDLFAYGDLKFTDTVDTSVDVIFLCAGHGQSKELLSGLTIPSYIKIIDLSSDFRLKDSAHFNSNHFVYGLSEFKHGAIKKAQAIANPGCFATAIQLSILPLFKENLIKGDVHVHAITGSTGAGKGLSDTTHFSWRNNNVSTYKVFNHQHMDEILESVAQVCPDYSGQVHFVPLRGPFSRGILASIYCEAHICLEELVYLFKTEYNEAPFVHVTTDDVDLKQVINTNQVLIQLQKIGNQIHITTVIDNLVKGASGQAVQNMNLMFGLDETSGLQLKSNYF